MVVDTSVILAVYFSEPHAQWAAEQLAVHSGHLLMSTVNLTETLILIRDRQPALAEELEDRLLNSGIRFIAPDIEQCRVAAAARLRYPLNLGDCFAYALSAVNQCSILAIDADFRSADRPVVHP